MALQLTPALEQRLEHLAAETNRSPADLAHEAITSYLQHIETLALDVREGDESAERDGVLSTAQVMERITKRYQAA